MLVSNLVGKRTAETPKDALTPSHQLLLRGGYVRQMGQGIYSLLPLAQRVRAKIERIIREEMDAIDGQEILMPLVTPAELWQESGRYEAVGSELVRFTDRTDHPHVLNMTNEETVVDVVRSNVDSYRQLPVMVYQIQTKFRDEPRSRAGLIRVREFTMKDGYSFHRTQDDLAEYYDRCHVAYQRIFKRCGLTQVVDIESDVGMMGGSLAHEFMLVSPHGEDTLLLCDNCGYRANREVATTKRIYPRDEAFDELVDVETPDQKTIEEVATFLKTTPDRCSKAVLFMADGKPLIAFVRGDLEVNQAKLRNHVKARDLRPMREDEAEQAGIVAGYVGPVGLPEGVSVVVDESVVRTGNLVIGANRAGYHRTGFNAGRDLTDATPVDLAEVQDKEPCPECGSPLRATRGIEIGNIFQLGVKYSQSMGFTYQEEDGGTPNPIMGCYGIGVGRTLACIMEEHHDDRGPLWPMSVAPFQVAVCCLQIKKEGVLDTGRGLHKDLLAAGVESILDDRSVGAGFMFADADLISAPVRAVVSPRNLKKGMVELKYRTPGETDDLPTEIPLEGASTKLKEIVDTLLSRYGMDAVEPAVAR